MASHIHQKYGITTIVSSNPFNGENPLDIDIGVINELANNQVSEIYYMGHSNGAVIGACWGGQYPLIKRMLLINPPIMMNWHKTKQGLKSFQGERATFIFGEHDPSAKYAGLIELLKQGNLHLVMFPNADHNFKGLLPEFMELPETYLLR